MTTTTLTFTDDELHILYCAVLNLNTAIRQGAAMGLNTEADLAAVQNLLERIVGVASLL